MGPTPRPDIFPLPAGTNLLYTQSGRIEYVPLDGYSMKKDEAKTALHLPVSIWGPDSSTDGSAFILILLYSYSYLFILRAELD